MTGNDDLHQISLVEQSLSEFSRVRELSHHAISLGSPEEDFDRIAIAATEMLGTRFGGVSLVDSDYVWLKARVGIDKTALCRDDAFCGYVIGTDCDYFAIPDTLADPRFSNNPAVIGAGIRFYSAIPLVIRGHRLGTLWVMDTNARTLQPKEILLLKGLAAQTCQLLDAYHRHPLSGFPNSTSLEKGLQVIIDLEKTQQSQAAHPHEENPALRYAVVFLKVQHVHQANLIFGRKAVEAALKDFSKQLHEWIDERDLHAQASFSKFAFAIREERGIGFDRRLDALENLISKPFRVGDTHIDPTISVGVSFYPEHGHSAKALLERAENIAARIDPHLTSSIRVHESAFDDDLKILSSLHTVLDQPGNGRELRPHYQPQINFATCELVGFEALARWCHPEIGQIPPQRFIALAEQNRLIFQLDMHIFEQVCRDLRSWIDMGLRTVPISSNFSRATLSNPNATEKIREIVERYGIPENCIEIEITEHGFNEDLDMLKSIAGQLHSLGLRISIDDFGSGMSNLSALRFLQFDRLKIDRDLSTGISASPHSQGILRFITSIATALGVDVLCEGIEQRADLDALRLCGISCIQGWIFSKAVPSTMVPDIFAKLSMDNAGRQPYIDDPSLISALLDRPA